MNNLEGIRFTENPEDKFEKTSMEINEDVNSDDFSDCKLTEREKLEKLKKELESMNFDDCFKTEQTTEIDEDYEDCRKAHR